MNAFNPQIVASLVVGLFIIGNICNMENKHGKKEENNISTQQEVIPERIFFMLPEDADYKIDFNESIEKGDFRFVGIMGYSLIVPSVPDYDDKYSKSNGVKIIEGTSDSIEDSMTFQLYDFYQNYAENYNLLLLEHLKIRRTQ